MCGRCGVISRNHWLVGHKDGTKLWVGLSGGVTLEAFSVIMTKFRNGYICSRKPNGGVLYLGQNSLVLSTVRSDEMFCHYK